MARERATSRTDAASLRDSHTPLAVRERLGQGPSQSYLQDFIYGAIDGAVTTFAVVAGVEGSNLDETVVVILGGANLVADGFSMAASNFLGTRAANQQRERARRVEERHVDLLPEGEREEIRQIFALKGFEGDELERVVDVITANRARWVDTMLTDELGLSPTARSELRAAVATFSAFVTVGFLPLAAFVYDVASPGEVDHALAWSSAMTAVAFFLVGAVKSRFVDQPWWRSALETLFVGGVAAVLAYGAGALLQHLV